MPDQVIPQFQLGHRLRLALEATHTSIETMAAALGVHTNTVHNYMRGETTPKLGALRVWAQVTAVPLQWLETGELSLEDELKLRTGSFLGCLTCDDRPLGLFALPKTELALSA